VQAGTAEHVSDVVSRHPGDLVARILVLRILVLRIHYIPHSLSTTPAGL